MSSLCLLVMVIFLLEDGAYPYKQDADSRMSRALICQMQLLKARQNLQVAILYNTVTLSRQR